jgi:hypothetical protein
MAVAGEVVDARTDGRAVGAAGLRRRPARVVSGLATVAGDPWTEGLAAGPEPTADDARGDAVGRRPGPPEAPPTPPPLARKCFAVAVVAGGVGGAAAPRKDEAAEKPEDRPDVRLDAEKDGK